MTKGIIIADLLRVWPGRQRHLTLMDEVLTPDSSRYWPVGYEAAFAAGADPPV
jgi:phosphoribosylaminoimidazole-succinocarboxamide synthase